MNVLLLKLSSLLGLSLTAGINLYATVAVVGLVTKYDLIKGLPSEFQAFNNDLVIILALILYACEFAADKIPAFDSVWDSVHTVVRPFGAAFIAMTVVGEAEPTVLVIAGMLGATLGLATHTAKAGTRLIVNTSPEPVSNIALSLGEDAAVVGMSVLVMSHPYISLGVSLVLLALLVRFGPGLWRGALLVVRAVPARIGSALPCKAEASLTSFLPDALDGAVDERISGDEEVRASRVCYARRVKGCGSNRKGYLVVTDRRLLFAFRRFFKTRTKEWEVSCLEKAGLNRRFLVDVLRVKSEGKYLSFIFLKSRSDAVERLSDRLGELIGQEEPAVSGEVLGKVLPLNATGGPS